MSEIHNRTSQTVYLDVYGGNADELPSAVFTAVDDTSRNLLVTQQTTPPDGVSERYNVTLNMADTKSDGHVKITWGFSIDGVDVDKVDHFDVVTPYLSLSEVKEIWPSATEAQLISVEAAVRHIINAHTGQSFGLSTKTVTIEGHGESALRLPERLVEVTGFGTLNSNLDPRAVIVISDGWYIKKAWADAVGDPLDNDSRYWGDYRDSVFDNNIYSDPDGDGEPPLIGPLGYRPGPIIVAPGTGTSTPWRNDYPFRITGRWGYEYVPEPVREAARLLVNDYACSEALYRDRYLESIKAADWRMQFSSRAWEYTGNVRADQLLSEYVLLDWATI